MIFNFLALLQVLQCAFLIFHFLECFLPYSRSDSVCVSFFMFFSFLCILQVLLCAFLIFQVFSVSCLIPGLTVCVSHFMCFPVSSPYSRSYIVHVFECFLPYSRSYSVCVSFSTIFSFLFIIQVLQCVFLIFHVF